MFKRREDIIKCRRVVVKIGSNLIASPGKGLNLDLMENLVRDISSVKKKNLEIILVSSGAIAFGTEIMKMQTKKLDKRKIPVRQALAAIGQSRLIRSYEKYFADCDIRVAQVLLTNDDLSNRKRFLNAKNTLLTLLEYGIVPIINENDTVSVDEIKLGDNDNLASQVVNLISANLLILLSDVDGLHSADPKLDSNATRFEHVENVTREIENLAGDIPTGFGTGGMYSKIRAIKRAAALGAGSILADGRTKNVISRILKGENLGTFFSSGKERITSRKHWIGFSLKAKGCLMLDKGAEDALLQGGKSLLPSGVITVEGKFDIGDAVECVNRNGQVLAKGIVNYSSSELALIKGQKSGKIEKILGYKYNDEVIHRDDMLIINN